MSNASKQPYRVAVKSSTGLVAIKTANGKVKIHTADGSQIVIPITDEIAIWPCKETSKLTAAPESTGEIESLDCSKNQLLWLRAGDLHSLKGLNCAGNHLQRLILAGPPTSSAKGPRDIEFLDCSCNQLVELDLSELGCLQRVNCSSNRLKSLRLGKNLKRLAKLDCSKNQLPLIDLVGLVALQYLNAVDNDFGHGTSPN